MRVLTVHGPADLRRAGAADAVVRIRACGVCGGDPGFPRRGRVRGPDGGPMAIGHEAVGAIAAVARAVTGVRLGRRVVVDALPMRDARLGDNLHGRGAGAGRRAKVGHDALPRAIDARRAGVGEGYLLRLRTGHADPPLRGGAGVDRGPPGARRARSGAAGVDRPARAGGDPRGRSDGREDRGGGPPRARRCRRATIVSSGSASASADCGGAAGSRHGWRRMSCAPRTPEPVRRGGIARDAGGGRVMRRLASRGRLVRRAATRHADADKCRRAA